MKSLKYYISKLKMKYKFSIQDTAKDSNINESAQVLKSHYLWEERNVLTTHGNGNVYTPITHHKNEHLPEELHDKHIIDTFTDRKGNVLSNHPSNKTGTFSNKRYFVPEENISTEDINNKVEFADKKSIIPRMQENNVLEHMKHHLKTREKPILNIIINTFTEELVDENTEEIPVEVIRDKDSITVIFEQINNN